MQNGETLEASPFACQSLPTGVRWCGFSGRNDRSNLLLAIRVRNANGKGNPLHPHPGPLPMGEGEHYGIKYTPPTMAIASAAAPRNEIGTGGIIHGAQLPGR